ncbi:hypothetical protein C8R47DRAFT_1195645 [Mycena vitilis]|nr:hypothetical protein C8R47DRAFT_1195645 [Mycena vitilis]
MANFIDLPEGYVLNVGKPPQVRILRLALLSKNTEKSPWSLSQTPKSFLPNPGGYEDRWDPAYTEIIEYLVPRNKTTIIGKQQRIGTDPRWGEIPYTRYHAFVEVLLGDAIPAVARPARLRMTMGDAMTQVAAQAIFAFKTHKGNYPNVTVPQAFLIATVGPWLTLGFADRVNDSTVLDNVFLDALRVLHAKSAAEDVSADNDREAETGPGIPFDRSTGTIAQPIACSEPHRKK